MLFSLKGRLPAARHRPIVQHRRPLRGIALRQHPRPTARHHALQSAQSEKCNQERKPGQEKRKAPDSRQALTRCVMKGAMPIGRYSAQREEASPKKGASSKKALRLRGALLAHSRNVLDGTRLGERLPFRFRSHHQRENPAEHHQTGRNQHGRPDAVRL